MGDLKEEASSRAEKGDQTPPESRKRRRSGAQARTRVLTSVQRRQFPDDIAMRSGMAGCRNI